MLIQIGIAIIECFIFCDFIFLGMLYKLEFPMYFYCGILNVGEGIEYFLGEKKIMYAVVVTNERASDLAGKSGFVKSKISSRSLAKGTGHITLPELGRQHLLTWQNSPSTPAGGLGRSTLTLLELTPSWPQAVGLKNCSSQVVYHPPKPRHHTP